MKMTLIPAWMFMASFMRKVEGKCSAREPQKQNLVTLRQYKKTFEKDQRNDKSRI
jgi:hypothetical protein